MRIHAARAGERGALLALWERSVRASHHFLAEEDIAFYRPLVGEFLDSGIDLWVARNGASGGMAGFMGLDAQCLPVKLEALFIDAGLLRRGFGALLVRHALSLYRDIGLDVNEQNPGARAFYLRMGFRETGRSALDGAGKPFPLIHMRFGATLP
ncbi:MAG: GNAT family N-acetyltransferase [Deltaproteobacteria bacterium]|nr:GNAT family N-acetyltransferase [Deltaproteobacteria bacterium]